MNIIVIIYATFTLIFSSSSFVSTSYLKPAPLLNLEDNNNHNTVIKDDPPEDWELTTGELSSDESHVSFSCPAGWVNYNDTKCFKFIPQEAIYDMALETCSNLSANLVSHASKDERIFLSKMVGDQRVNNSMTFIWLGMSQLPNGEWHWYNGNPVLEVPNINSGCYRYNLTKTCASDLLIHVKNRFDTLTCSYDCRKDEVYTICETPVTISIVNKSNVKRRTISHLETTSELTLASLSQSDRCDIGWDIHDNKCYHLSSVMATGHEEAIGSCFMSNSAKPVSVTSPDLQRVLEILIYQKDHGLSAEPGKLRRLVLLGGKAEFNSKKFSWDDGSPFQFSNWAPGEPTFAGNCIAMDSDPDRRGKWKTVPCNQSFRVVCGKPARELKSQTQPMNHDASSTEAIDSSTSTAAPKLLEWEKLVTPGNPQNNEVRQPDSKESTEKDGDQVKNASTMVIIIAAILVVILLIICVAVRLRKKAQNQQRIALQSSGGGVSSNGTNVYSDPRSEKEKSDAVVTEEKLQNTPISSSSPPPDNHTVSV